MSDKTIENHRAVQKPATLNPGTILAAKIINNAFITSENSPRVSIVKGSAIIFTTGLIKTFITPRTTARTIEPSKVTVTPGII